VTLDATPHFFFFFPRPGVEKDEPPDAALDDAMVRPEQLNYLINSHKRER
jgi:hypothetical protein